MQMAKNRIAAALLCLMLLVAVLPVQAYAIDPIELDRETSFAVWFHDGEKNLPGVHFDVYRVADTGTFAEFTLTGDFADYPVEITDLDAAGWKAAAETLTGYVRRDGLTAVAGGSTGQDGKVTFSGLMPGLYLVIGETSTVDGHRYTPEPLLISLPNRAADEDQWTYDVTTSPKYSRKPTGSGKDDTVERKVLKVWDDGEGEDRPASIQVQLLKNGEVAETVTLSAENHWRYTWTRLAEGEEWRVVEKETPEGYTVSVRQEGVTFVVTNTREEPGQPDVPTEPDNPDTPDKPTLPQTGQLWWPVPMLACGGLLLFLLGWVRKEQAGHEG